MPSGSFACNRWPTLPYRSPASVKVDVASLVLNECAALRGRSCVLNTLTPASHDAAVYHR
jgi:hypothetical protein